MVFSSFERVEIFWSSEFFITWFVWLFVPCSNTCSISEDLICGDFSPFLKAQSKIRVLIDCQLSLSPFANCILSEVGETKEKPEFLLRTISSFHSVLKIWKMLYNGITQHSGTWATQMTSINELKYQMTSNDIQ